MNIGAVVDPSHRQLGLETDVNNTNFTGARTPDDLLWVQFTVKPMQNNFQTVAQSRPIFEDQTWIEIRIPGNQLLTIERPMDESDKYRFPRQWAYFQQTHGPEGQNVGTPLTQWPLLRPSQIEELKALRFYTVEQVAFASDDQLKSMGMGPGMAPSAFRERAKLFLESAKDSALAVRQAEAIKAREAEVEQLKKDQQAQAQKHEAEMKELRELIKQATAKGK